MLEQVKIIVDEQTKVTLTRLQEALSRALAPLAQLERISVGTADAGNVSAEIATEFRKISNVVEEGLSDVTRKLSSIEGNQDELFSKFAQLVSNQNEMLKRLDTVKDGVKVGTSRPGETEAGMTEMAAKFAMLESSQNEILKRLDALKDSARVETLQSPEKEKSAIEIAEKLSLLEVNQKKMFKMLAALNSPVETLKAPSSKAKVVKDKTPNKVAATKTKKDKERVSKGATVKTKVAKAKKTSGRK